MFLSHRAKAYFHNCVSISFLISIFSIQTPLLIENDLFLKLSCVTFSSDYFVLQDWPAQGLGLSEKLSADGGVNIFQGWIFFRSEYFSVQILTVYFVWPERFGVVGETVGGWRRLSLGGRGSHPRAVRGPWTPHIRDPRYPLLGSKQAPFFKS